MKILIIEDEEITANNLEQILLNIEPDINVQAKIGSVNNAINWLAANKTDLIFLDIHLSDGNAFKIFESIEIQTPIIFTTAYDQYAIKAFQLNSIDYLLKPIKVDLLKKSLQKYKSIQAHKNRQNIDFEHLKKLFLKSEQQYQKRFMVYAGQKIKTIDKNDIACFYSEQKNVFLCTKEGKTYGLDYSLNKLEAITSNEEFFRINRKYIISLNSIKNIYPMSKSRLKIELKIKLSEDLLVSLSRTSDFKQWLNQ